MLTFLALVLCETRLGRVPYPLHQTTKCAGEEPVTCHLRLDPAARIVLPVRGRSSRVETTVVRRDAPCDCTTEDVCVSNGTDVRPRCGCGDFSASGEAICYVLGGGSCSEPEVTPSAVFFGAAYRPCSAPPPPPDPLACDDPLFDAQWHHAAIRAPRAWERTSGEGSTTVIVDDGVQYDHPDLHVSREESFGWDFETATRVDTAHDPLSRHGTSSAGIAAGVKDNGVGGCGVSPSTSLVAVKLLASYGEADDYYFSDDRFVATVRAFRTANGTVLSNSWGPADDLRVEGPGILQSYSRVDAAITSFGREGRSGRGGVLVFAAGNGGALDNANDDGFASHPYTFAVGAVGNDGRRTSFSEPGACLDGVAPSGVPTTDVMGGGGYSPGNATMSFGGTSAAAPMLAATLALVLSTRPDLSLRDLKRIVHTTATPVDPHDPGWIRNRNGRRFNWWYGFGKIDAAAAVDAATNWTLLPPSEEVCSPVWSEGRSLPPAGVTEITLPSLPAEVEHVDEARLFVDVHHPRRGDVGLSLLSPGGTESPLAMQIPSVVEMQTVGFLAHSYLTHAFLGENATRDGWRVRLSDSSGVGHVRRLAVCVRGDVAGDAPAFSPLLFHLRQGNPPPPPPPSPAAQAGTIRRVVWSTAVVVVVLVASLFLRRR